MNARTEQSPSTRELHSAVLWLAWFAGAEEAGVDRPEGLLALHGHAVATARYLGAPEAVTLNPDLRGPAEAVPDLDRLRRRRDIDAVVHAS